MLNSRHCQGRPKTSATSFTAAVGTTVKQFICEQPMTWGKGTTRYPYEPLTETGNYTYDSRIPCSFLSLRPFSYDFIAFSQPFKITLTEGQPAGRTSQYTTAVVYCKSEYLALCDTTHKHLQGVLYFQTAIAFHTTQVHVFSFRAVATYGRFSRKSQLFNSICCRARIPKFINIGKKNV